MVDVIIGFLETLQETPYVFRVLLVFGVSLLPGVGGPATTIPIGHFVLGLHLPVVTAACVLGNLIPVPFVILFIRVIFDWIRKISSKLGTLVDKLERKASSKSDRMNKGVFVGLTLYVAVPLPLPGMGAWTAALLAAIFHVDVKVAFPAIALGVILSALITVLGVMGVIALI